VGCALSKHVTTLFIPNFCASNSAYYGKPINIVIKKCDLVQESPSATVFDREVDLTMDGKVRRAVVGRISISDS